MHLLLLNLLTAGVQLVMIILAFAEAKRAEGSPAGLSLVGLDQVILDQLEADDDDDQVRPLMMRVNQDDEIDEPGELLLSAVYPPYCSG